MTIDSLDVLLFLFGTSLLFHVIYLGPNYGGGNEDNGDLPQKIPGIYCYSPCSQPCSRPPLTHAFTGDSWTPRQSPVGSLFLSPGFWCTWLCCALQESISQSYVSSDSSIVGLMATSSKRIMPYPHPEPLFLRQTTANRTSTGDVQTQFCLSLCGAPGSWCTQGLFEPSEHLWQKGV